MEEVTEIHSFIRINSIVYRRQQQLVARLTQSPDALLDHIQLMEDDTYAETILRSSGERESSSWDGKDFVVRPEPLIKCTHVESLGKDEPKKISALRVLELYQRIQFCN